LTKIIFARRKAVSETIATMLLLAITVVGAVMISNFVSDGFFSAVSQGSSDVDSSSDSIQLTGYDTRDSDTLINVVSLDNKLNSVLCAKGNDPGCTITLPNINNIPNDPVNPGTEFISLQLRNMNPNSVFLRNIQVNNVLHSWDDGTAGWSFDATLSADAGTKYPRAGFFSIIPSPERPNPTKQFLDIEVQGNEEVRVIIKLSENLSDIKMWDSMQIVVNFGGPVPADFIVTSGDAKW
jgi:flagellin-like protein